MGNLSKNQRLKALVGLPKLLARRQGYNSPKTSERSFHFLFKASVHSSTGGKTRLRSFCCISWDEHFINLRRNPAAGEIQINRRRKSVFICHESYFFSSRGFKPPTLQWKSRTLLFGLQPPFHQSETFQEKLWFSEQTSVSTLWMWGRPSHISEPSDKYQRGLLLY